MNTSTTANSSAVIGAQIVTQLRQELPLDIEILALGANAIATDRMMKAKVSRGASGENAIHVSVNLADFIVAPIGMVIPNSMLGEITPVIAEAVAGAREYKLILPRRFHCCKSACGFDKQWGTTPALSLCSTIWGASAGTL
jgi:hypothetical protein